MTLPASRQIYEFGKRKITTPAIVNSKQWTSGDVFLVGALAFVIETIRDIGAGVDVNGTYAGTFELPCGTGVTAALDANAYYDTVNKTVVTASGTDIILIGKFALAKVSGQLVALVMFNNK